MCVRASFVADEWQVMPVVNLPAAQSESGGCVVVQAGEINAGLGGTRTAISCVRKRLYC